MPEQNRKTIQELSREDIVRACEENYINYWRLVGKSPNAEFSEDGGITRCMTGIRQDVFNVVLKCDLDRQNIERRIDEAIEDFKSRRIPLLWHTGLTTTPGDIGDYLEARGFPHDYDLAAMAVDVSASLEPKRFREGVSARPVENEDDCVHWADCLARSWESPSGTAEWMLQNACFNVRLEQERRLSLPRKMYLGFIDGKPAGACMLVWDNDIAGLEMVGTVHAARYKGVGSAMITRALGDAALMGFKFVVVLATVEGVKLYEKCGFERYGELPEHSMNFSTI
ncbi:MAG: GNAT family N-acetyltransferase [Thermoplasmata archaeon]